ncbi:MAG: hypothetical protein KDJ75_03220 [Alphaproteobacteria bacterium]|nr:hypothetical protein [Alphaproteobacteria bacterium]
MNVLSDKGCNHGLCPAPRPTYTRTDRLHKIWWLWVPILIALIQVILETTLSSDVLARLHSESGPHEAFEFLFLLYAFIICILILPKLDWRTQKPLLAWVLIATVSCFYVAGEEISWGQHLLKWSTPEYWTHLNDQGETNLHNTSSWLDQKPRLILLIGVLTGGLVIPALQRFKPGLLPQKFAIIYPPAFLGVVALFVLGVEVLGKIDDALKNVVILERGSEVEELYLFYFVMLYMIVLRRRILQNQR